MMDLQTKSILEQEGCRIIETAYNTYFNTSTFIMRPRRNTMAPYYESFESIPLLNNQTEIEVSINAFPIDDRTGISTAQQGTEVHFIRDTPAAAVGAWVFLAWLVIGISVVTCFFLLRDIIRPRCEFSQVPIDNCRSVITLEDCTSNIINSCTGEWEGTWEKGGEWDWVLWTIAGIGGLFVLVTILPWLKPKPKPRTSNSEEYYYPSR